VGKRGNGKKGPPQRRFILRLVQEKESLKSRLIGFTLITWGGSKQKASKINPNHVRRRGNLTWGFYDPGGKSNSRGEKVSP